MQNQLNFKEIIIIILLLAGTLTKTAVAIQAASTISSTSPTRKKKPVGIKSIAQDDKEEEIKAQLKNVLEILNNVFKKDHQVQVRFFYYFTYFIN